MIKKIEVNKEDVKIKISEKRKDCELIPLRYMLSKYHSLTLWHMAKQIVINEEGKNKIHQFQFRYMSNPVLNINKAVREQVGIYLTLTVDYKTMICIRKVLRK